jgi:branched-chain amino acid transport system permease protein
VKRWIRVAAEPWWGRSLLGGISLAVILIIVWMAALLFRDAGVEATVTVLLINVTIVIGIQVFSGTTGLVSFGHVGFMALGAYVAAWLTMPPALKAQVLPDLPAFLMNAELPLAPALLVAFVVPATFAFVVGLALMRLEAGALATGTFGVLIVVYVVLSTSQSLTNSGQTIYGVPEWVDLRVAGVAAIATAIVARLYRGSGPGLQLRAASTHEQAAAANGVPILRARLISWTLSAGVVGIGGGLWAWQITAFSPRSFYFQTTFLLMAMLIIGGLGSVSGAIVGAVAVTVISEALRHGQGADLGFVQLPDVPGLAQVLLGVTIIVLMKLRPDGLAGFREVDERALVSVADQDAPVAPETPDALSEPGSLAAHNVERHFSGVRALKGVTMEVRTGEIVGLIGPNGSGKTTLINLLSGVLAPSSGRIVIDATDVSRSRADRRFRLGTARTFQNVGLFGHLDIAENVETPAVALPAKRPRRRETTKRLSRAGVSGAPSALPPELAYGEQRRVEIARALAGNPRFLLLDEPAAGMNDAETGALAERIRGVRDAIGCGILVTDHDLGFILTVCDRVVVLENGELIFEGDPHDARDDREVRRAYIGEELPVEGGSS